MEQLPLKGNENYVLLTDEDKKTQELSEKVLWEYIKELKKEFVETEREQKEIIKSLEADEIRIIEDEIYCRFENKVTSCPIEAGETDPKKQTVYQLNQWIYPKKRTMSKKDMAEVERLMKERLVSEGYTVKFKSIDEYLEE